MNNSIKIKPEIVLYLLAAVVALGVRLIGLGGLPLSDAEANLAMQSLDISRSQVATLPGDPAYVLLTGSLFFFTQATEFAARFWPAILGAVLPWVAYLLRGWIGKRPALILAFGFALDPGLVAISRQADGAGMSVVFVLLAVGLAMNRRSLAAGIFAGLSLLGGGSLWPGLIVAAVVLFLFGKSFITTELAQKALDWKMVGAGVLSSLVVVGTLVMTTPYGLGGIGSSLGEYFSGWGAQLTGRLPVAWTQMLLSLLIYHPLPLFFCCVAIIRSLFDPQDRLGRALAAWFGLALLISVLYPSRQVPDLVWCLVPMWILAGRELARIRIDWNEHGRTEIGYAALVVIMIVFMSWSLVGVPNPSDNVLDANRQTSVARFLAGLFLFLIIFLLVLWGWGLSSAARGARLGFAILLPFALIASIWNATGLSGAPETEMWRTSPLLKDSYRLQTTLDALSSWNHTSPRQLDVAVVGIDSDGLRWMLRNYRDVRYLQAIPSEDNSSVIITPASISLGQGVSYRGQDFVWSSKPAWEILSPYDFLQWAIFRDVIMDSQQIILWVRSDLFPGAIEN